MNYEYLNIINCPNLDNIHLDVGNSLMENKDISHCIWEFDLKKLMVFFNFSLNDSDKIILDNIVSENS